MIEKEKYEYLYKHGYKTVSASLRMALFIEGMRANSWKFLDVGCGHGVALWGLRCLGYDCTGIDITLEGLPEGIKEYVVEGTIWDMPFDDDEFDCTFSTDVLEHIPPTHIERAVSDIVRITKMATIHVVSTKRSTTMYKGEGVHLTVQPVIWWNQLFTRKIGSKNVEWYIEDEEVNT